MTATGVGITELKVTVRVDGKVPTVSFRLTPLTLPKRRPLSEMESAFYGGVFLCLIRQLAVRRMGVARIPPRSSSCLSVRPQGTTRFPLDGFSLNLVLEYFSKICGKKIQVSVNSHEHGGTVYCVKTFV